MSLAALSIYIPGPEPKWCRCDVILPSDLLSKHTAFSVSPLKADLTLLISHANRYVTSTNLYFNPAHDRYYPILMSGPHAH